MSALIGNNTEHYRVGVRMIAPISFFRSGSDLRFKISKMGTIKDRVLPDPVQA